MKRHISTSIPNFLTLTIVGFLLTNCASSHKFVKRITVKDDIVHSAKRVELEYTLGDHDNRTPLIYVSQTLVKLIKENGESTINVYDKLTLIGGSFKLEDSVYMIINGSVYPIVPKLFEYDKYKNQSSSTKKISTGDDEEVEVVTGYQEYNRDIVRINYQLSDKIINAIKTANKVSFRYYAGPSMITVDIEDGLLKAVKEVINFN